MNISRSRCQVDLEREMNPSPEDQLEMDKSWNWLLKCPAGVMLNLKKEWILFEEMKKTHSDHPVMMRCYGCSHPYCTHMIENICISRPLCTDCDRLFRPNPYNLKNRDLVARYDLRLI